MSEFTYTAVTQSGETKKGRLMAESSSAALKQLHEMELYPVTVQEKASGKGAVKNMLGAELFARRALSLKDLQDVLERMHILISSGLPLEEVLKLLAEQGGTMAVQRVLQAVLTDVQEGRSLSAAMEYTKAFPAATVATIKAGETSGNLEEVVTMLAEQTGRSLKLSGKVRSAMAYPTFLLLFCVAVVIFLLAVIVPQLTEIFTSMRKDLPASTTMLIGAGDWFASWYWTLPLGAMLGVVALKSALKNPKGRLKLHAFLLRVPIFGKTHRLKVVSQFSGIMHVLLTGGVPLLSALQVAAATGGSAVLEHQLEEVDEGLKAGRSFVLLLHDDVFSAQDLRILDAGERSGKLEAMFGHISHSSETELKRTLTAALSLVEPVLILCMGSIVGFVVLAIFLPILDMSQM